MEDLLKTVQNGISSGDPTITGIILACIIVLLTIVVFALRSGGSKKQGLLLLGLCDSGKTTIFTRLVHGKFVNTHTSIKENSGMYNTTGKKSSVRLVDIPGYERMRDTILDQYKGAARAVVYVVDSLTLQKEIKDVAEYLYNILIDPVISQNALPVLIACNKQDQTLAKGSKVVQALLEKEITTLRVTKSAALEGTSGTGNNNTYLGSPGADFAFSQLKSHRVVFVECAARGNKDTSLADLAAVQEWIAATE